jgi:hypothetical protein
MIFQEKSKNTNEQNTNIQTKHRTQNPNRDNFVYSCFVIFMLCLVFVF